MPHEKIKMIFSVCGLILLVCPLKNVSCCGSRQTLTVDEGKDVILQVNQTGLSFITWNFEKHLIAITRPGERLELTKHSYRYPERLFSSADGSLVITRLTAKDGQIYRAEVFDENWSYLCVQLYDVRVDEYAGISPSVDPLEACSSTKQLFCRLGENVTLTLPSHSRLANVAWDVNNIDHIAITQPGGIVSHQNHSYHGKVSAMGDGSLRLLNLTLEEQHVYRANLFTNQWDYLCNQHYDVRVKKIYEEPSRSHGLQNHIRLALSACILLVTFCILLYHFKTENS